MNGIVVINKPNGITSHDVVDRIRRKFRMKRVGHAGTLDPLATGVLVLLLGKSTKLFDRFVDFDKAYRATMILGTKTISADTEGEIIETKAFSHITEGQIKEVFERFQGDIEQLPPMVSAVKIGGKKLYEMARKGVNIERKPRNVRIDRLDIEEIDFPDVRFYMECSKGTYVRQLADDVGDALGCGACISQIQRTKVGPFNIEEAVTIEDLNEDHIRDWTD
ncbi:MAG: tRNA pseudouridine(55) synthase TruB [Omnitrophica WOR_2 bacterium GWF2_38_59]|nr:MAG: tRNA pseudouridine(55) synthase TruB [Omnitrophica WOR_2 bacterium GWA2_37_7]OGX24737.1 MAG: tRNA pseudouridine(55) synthase TruB [Omnitrophica WOR_2 bacterium GWF2_38_59]OGX51129.1 MAG: tRNA pseudouridine(55) synthase TruB [Omnitrophica WOR_2 bacterium RIFOXYA2_FULL_38_17]OGX51439.1 MAG: tRNA pseudouridine(55) synthase TruB [Omnitrophica WOR_2 bacterium RIFOXYA12_FULL_38_10]OGX56110.1 MAG: tRNA pseudouridine(55) synthase TruB [Omnitrophica WOR_2 bacterium RIFOXYC2_FULL_38_12]OGX60453.